MPAFYNQYNLVLECLVNVSAIFILFSNLYVYASYTSLLRSIPSVKGQHLFIFGLGYVGNHVAEEAILLNWSVSGTVQSSDELPFCYSKIEDIFLFDEFLTLKSLSHNQCPTHILITIPPTVASVLDETLMQSEVKRECKITRKIQNFLFLNGLFSSKVKWIGYLSSTGVYTERNGGWVHEASTLYSDHELQIDGPETGASTYKALSRVYAENSWLHYGQQFGIPINIFRSAGIYGPKRNLFKRLFNVNNLSRVSRSAVVSRIHINDLSKVVLAAMDLQSYPIKTIMNVADNLPATQYEVCFKYFIDAII